MSRASIVTRTAALLACALGLACGEPEPEADAAFPVTLARVEARDVVERIEAAGQLVAPQHAQVAAEVGGRITEILQDEGAHLEVGDEVMAIDPERRKLERDSASASYAEARAQVGEAQREHKRVTDLRERKVASVAQLDAAATALAQARSRAAAARANLGVADRALRDATVRAPFAGSIARREVAKGEYVQPGQTLFELVALDPIEVEFEVPEVDSSRVALGQTVDVHLAPYPDESFGARVSFVSPTIDTRTRTLRVKAELENTEGRLRPGLFARVDLGVSNREGVAMIPEEAVLQRSDGEVVFRAHDDDRVERVLVRTGARRHGFVEVVAGLRPGEHVVSRGQAWLSDGQVVRTRNPDGTISAPRALPEVAEGRDGELPANVP